VNNQQRTTAIILTRTDFGEADRILTLLTPELGKLRLMARGVRKIKSKLAGGIELFSISDITFIRGRGDIGTLISARLDRHYGDIVKQIDRVQLGYEIIKKIHKATEDAPEAEYFHLLEQSFRALDDNAISTPLVRLWFSAQLVKLAGQTPNLVSDTAQRKLQTGVNYNFDFDSMSFLFNENGHYGTNHIKLLRLLFSNNVPAVINHIENLELLLSTVAPMIATMLNTSIRV
jgi:DNA repair protein RecO (recombination protein O)